jgi:drug/metabolite transporter (DMT)-like permease
VLEYQFWLSPIIPATMAIIALLSASGFALDGTSLLLALVAGTLWAGGAVAYSIAVDEIGITRSTPVKNLGPILTTLFGIVIFREYTLDEPIPLMQAILGSSLMGVAAVLIGRCAAPENERALAFATHLSDLERRRRLAYGFALALAAGLCFAAYTVPLKFVFLQGYPTFRVMFWMALAVPLTGYLLYLGVHRRPLIPLPDKGELVRCQLAGLMWVGGGGLGALAMQFIPMSVSWPITNLSTLFAVAFGVVLFREVRLDRHRSDVLWGSAAYGLGLLLLALALRPVA